MFDFEEDSWDVDKKAEALNASLFDSSKKKAKRKTSKGNTLSAVSYDLWDENDNDDDKISKREKKILKKKDKKLKKDENEATAIDDSNFKFTQNNNKDADVQSHKKTLNKKIKKKNQENSVKNSPTANSNNSKLTNTVKGDESLMESKVKKKKAKKRKHEESTSDSTTVPQSPEVKKAKLNVENGIGGGEVVEGETPKENKKRRNKKKKNNCKPNKYKHLALGSKKDSSSNGISSSVEVGFGGGLRVGSEAAVSDTKESSPKGVGGGDNSKKLSKKVKNKAKKMVASGQLSSSPEPKVAKNNVSAVTEVTDDKSEKKKKKKKKKLTENGGDGVSLKVENIIEKPKKRLAEVDVIEAENTAKPSDGDEQHSPKKTKKVNKSKINYKSDILAKMLNESSLLETVEADNNDDDEIVEKTQISNKKQKKRKEKKSKPQKTIQSEESIKKSDVQKSTHNSQDEEDCEKSEERLKVAALWAGKNNSSSLSSSSSSSSSKPSTTSSSFQHARQKLEGGRFRYLNEQLYRCSGAEALEMFRADRKSFHVYHDGYRVQVARWEVNPLDVFIKHLKNKSSSLVVADFGCGEAKLADSVPQKVHSFDLVASNSKVTACDMAHTPLDNESVDIAVFCLSLMGTNLSDYVCEANRVLKTGGTLKVAEVTSRFSGPVAFISAVSARGFKLLNKRDLTNMFYLMDFKKIKPVKMTKKSQGPELKLKPCVYKKR